MVIRTCPGPFPDVEWPGRRGSWINNRGVIEANRIGTRGGQIILSAATGSSKPAGAPKQTIRLGGTLSAAGRKSGEKGGRVVVTGENSRYRRALDVSA